MNQFYKTDSMFLKNHNRSKRTIRIFLLYLVFVFVSFSCDDDSSVSMQISEGFIVETKASTYQYGTHTLQTNTGEVLYALRSNSVNLYQYNDTYVIIKGSLINGYPVDGGPEYLDVKSLTIME
jgi:hypothetical protein